VTRVLAWDARRAGLPGAPRYDKESRQHAGDGRTSMCLFMRPG
jgi:hypothetical protein